MMDLDRDLSHLMILLDAALKKQSEKWLPSSYSGEGDMQNLISGVQRKEVVEWMLSVSTRFRFSRETSFLSVAILDKFLKIVKAQPKYLVCIGVTCLYIAAKIHEEDEVIPSTTELVRVSRCGCSVKEILRMETCILTQAAWDSSMPTSFQFLHLFYSMILHKCKDIFPGRLHIKYLHYMTKILESCLLHPFFLSFHPSTLALAVLSLQLRLVWRYWKTATGYLMTIIRIDEEELNKCCGYISSLFADILLMSVRVPNKKPLHQNSSKKQKESLKRKVMDSEDEDDYDLYEGIKKLYGEDSNCSVDVSMSTGNNSANCNSAACCEGGSTCIGNGGGCTGTSGCSNGVFSCGSEVARMKTFSFGLKSGKAL